MHRIHRCLSAFVAMGACSALSPSRPPLPGGPGRGAGDSPRQSGRDLHRGPLGHDLGFQPSNGAVRSPDAAWIPYSRLNTLTAEQRKRFIPLCPVFFSSSRCKWGSYLGEDDIERFDATSP